MKHAKVITAVDQPLFWNGTYFDTFDKAVLYGENIDSAIIAKAAAISACKIEVVYIDTKEGEMV